MKRFPVILFVMLHFMWVVQKLTLWIKLSKVPIRTKAIEQYFRSCGFISFPVLMTKSATTEIKAYPSLHFCTVVFHYAKSSVIWLVLGIKVNE